MKSLVFSALFFNFTVFLMADATAGQPLIVSFGSHDAEPYAIIQNELLIGGIIKDIMDEVGKITQINIRYRNVPRKRMDLFLLSGKIHVRLVSSPRWYTKQEKEKYRWSVPLFQEFGRYVVLAKDAFLITDIDDLIGRRLGTILGYQYPDALMERFIDREIVRADAKTLEANFTRLGKNWVDCLIDADILIKYYLKKHQAHEKFLISKKIVNSYNIQAMISRQTPVSIARVNAAFKQMKDSGKIQQILDKYK